MQQLSVVAFSITVYSQNDRLYNGETLAEVRARTEPIINEIIKSENDELIIVSHFAVLQVFLNALLDKDTLPMKIYDLKNAGLTTIEIREDGTQAVRISEIAYTETAPH